MFVSDLEKSLFVLPFSDAVDFVKICDLWLQNEWEVELVSRCVCFLLRFVKLVSLHLVICTCTFISFSIILLGIQLAFHEKLN